MVGRLGAYRRIMVGRLGADIQWVKESIEQQDKSSVLLLNDIVLLFSYISGLCTSYSIYYTWLKAVPLKSLS